MLIRITAPHFCAGIVLHERAAPIVRYMQDWDLEKILAYVERKGWIVEVL